MGDSGLWRCHGLNRPVREKIFLCRDRRQRSVFDRRSARGARGVDQDALCAPSDRVVTGVLDEFPSLFCRGTVGPPDQSQRGELSRECLRVKNTGSRTNYLRFPPAGACARSSSRGTWCFRQIFDRTNRPVNLFEKGLVAHVGMRPLIVRSYPSAVSVRLRLGFRNASRGTYVCMEGPQFSPCGVPVYRPWVFPSRHDESAERSSPGKQRFVIPRWRWSPITTFGKVGDKSASRK